MPRARVSHRPATTATLAAVAGMAVLPRVARAHGEAGVGPPDLAGLALGWSFEPLVAIPLLVAALAWVAAVRRVNAAHPANPVPIVRSVAFFGGLAAIAVALLSGVERYDTILFSVHMVQHLLLTLVAPPLLALSAPITLLLRASSAETRRRWILPVLHSRLVKIVAFPVVAGVVLAAVMWATHFSPLFDLALEDPFLHDLEHAIYLGAGLLFWWPVVGADPAPWRMSHPVRALYVFLQMPQNTFLAVALLSAGTPLYAHYATAARRWGPTPLADQQMAAGIMWLAGDLLFLLAVMGLVAAWFRYEERQTARADRQADAQRAALRANEARLEERLARERGADQR
jgi:putative copper resistance protein D